MIIFIFLLVISWLLISLAKFLCLEYAMSCIQHFTECQQKLQYAMNLKQMQTCVRQFIPRVKNVRKSTSKIMMYNILAA